MRIDWKDGMASCRSNTARAVAVLGCVLLAALGLRLALLVGPQTELEADEAIVGLMARHILQGERPIFYYMQPYMGSLEAYLAACSFALFGSSTFSLKLVPLLASLLFVVLVFATGYRLGGLVSAAVSGLYVAVPPAFLALWSLKARGGYIETLVVGQLLIVIALEIGKRRSMGLKSGLVLGFLAGLGLWVNPLVGVYLVPVGVYLALVLRRKLLGMWLAAALVGVLAGGYPLLQYNLGHGFATAESMFAGDWSTSEALTYLSRFFRYSLPVLVGLAQASSSPKFFWPAFESSPAAWPPVFPALASLFLLLLVLHSRRLLSLLLGGGAGADGRSLLSFLLVVVPVAFVLSKFRELTTEPRYLLPLYSAVPLVAVSLPLRTAPWRLLSALIVAAAIALNVYSIADLDPKLNLPDTAVGSTAANRAELTDFLLSHGLDRVYTDYWLGYPIAFESGERVIPSVISGGFNRYIPYAHLVSVSPCPAFLFVAGSEDEAAFLARLRERQVEVRKDVVSIYSVYWQATPLDRIRP